MNRVIGNGGRDRSNLIRFSDVHVFCKEFLEVCETIKAFSHPLVDESLHKFDCRFFLCFCLGLFEIGRQSRNTRELLGKEAKVRTIKFLLQGSCLLWCQVQKQRFYDACTNSVNCKCGHFSLEGLKILNEKRKKELKGAK